MKCQKYRDIILPDVDFVDLVSGLKNIKEFAYREGDIILATYPKCGTHWTGNMISRLKELDVSATGADTFLEVGPVEIFNTMTSPRIIWTHQTPERLPTEHLKNGGKIVVVLRNPKDVMVSFYLHIKHAALFHNNQRWEEFFESFMAGELPYGSYFDFVEKWEQFIANKPANVPVEVFLYEDFKEKYDETLARLNTFLGFNRDEEHLAKVKELTKLEVLREQDKAGKRETSALVRDDKGDSLIYRKGQVGGWKDYLTVAQSERVDKRLAESMRLGIISIRCDI